MIVQTKTKIPLDKEKVDSLAIVFEEKFKEDHLRFKALPGVTTNWGPERMVMLYQFAADKDAVQQDFADALGIDRSGVSRKCNSMNWNKFEEMLEKLCNMTKEDAIVHEAEVVAKKNQFKAEVKDRTKLITREAFFKNLTKVIADAQKILPSVKTFAPTVIEKKPKGPGTPEHVVLLLSDLHVGQEFTDDETGHINAYNMDLFYQRAEGLQKSVVEITNLHKRERPLPELHVFCLGDMVQGGKMNGEWGPASSAHTNVAKCAAIAGKVCGNMMRDWANHYEKINFTGVIGNHGRAGATKNSDPIGANWDNVAYSQLSAEFEGHKQISISYSDTFWAQKNVLGTEFLLVHGDYCGNSMNSLLALDQKMRGITQKVPNSKPFHNLCLGHFHSQMTIQTSMGRVMVNGSFVGADMHSLQHLKSGTTPSQRLLGVHPRNGITWDYWLDLEKTRE